MRPARVLFGLVVLLSALLIQLSVIGRLPLPGGPPDLLLVVVAAIALAEGPASGLATGFSAGLLADLSADHALGRLALAYALAGYVAGLFSSDLDRSAVTSFAAVAAAATVGILVFAVSGAVVGDPRTTLATLGRSLASSLPYDVALTPFVVPAMALAVRRLDPDPERRL